MREREAVCGVFDRFFLFLWREITSGKTGPNESEKQRIQTQ